MESRCSRVSTPAVHSPWKDVTDYLCYRLWKEQRRSLKGWMKDEYKELIWNQSRPMFIYCFRNLSILMMNLFSKPCRAFGGEFHLSQLRDLPCSVELSRPPALCKTVWTSQSWERAKLAEPAREPSPASPPAPECRWTHTPQTPENQAKQLGGATQPHGKATDRLPLALQRILLKFLWLIC